MEQTQIFHYCTASIFHLCVILDLLRTAVIYFSLLAARIYVSPCCLQSAHWVDLLADPEDENTLNAVRSLPETERKRREALWELFKSECVFLIDHLMVLKHVRSIYRIRPSVFRLLLYLHPVGLRTSVCLSVCPLKRQTRWIENATKRQTVRHFRFTSAVFWVKWANNWIVYWSKN